VNQENPDKKKKAIQKSALDALLKLSQRDLCCLSHLNTLEFELRPSPYYSRPVITVAINNAILIKNYESRAEKAKTAQERKRHLLAAKVLYKGVTTLL
jgi:hypothetical protein